MRLRQLQFSLGFSMVMMRSCDGIDRDTQFRSVVFPDPVPPAIKIFFFIRTQKSMNLDASRLIEFFSIMSWNVSFFFENFRMVIVGPLRANGGSMTLTLDPSASRASTMGEDSSTLRPSGPTIRPITVRSEFSLMN